MPQITIAAPIDYATQAARDEAVRLTTPVQLGTRNEEAGCLADCFAADPAAPTRVQAHELWADLASIAAHFEHPFYNRVRDVLQSQGIVATWNQIYAVGRHAPV